MRKFAPPPTKFGAQSAQAKGTATPTGTQIIHAPPPTKFAAAGPMQAKPGPHPVKMRSPQPAVPRTAPHHGSARHQWPAVIQKREDVPITLDGTIHPSTTGWYKQHVILRLKVFGIAISRLFAIVIYYENEYLQTINTSGFISKNANVQAGTGFRVKDDGTGHKVSMDAAHFMNTSINSSKIIKSMPQLDIVQQEAIKEIRNITASTTTQYQSDNVGPDKVIDSAMSEVAEELRKAGPTAVMAKGVKGIILTIAVNALARLKKSGKSGNANYQIAIDAIESVINETIDAIAYDLENDLALWQKEIGIA